MDGIEERRATAVVPNRLSRLLCGGHILLPRIMLYLFLISWRAMIGFHKHSGQDNHHGSRAAYGGDYEAQRHWMELTIHLPVDQWYIYDLQYWGLDYPPLTAYVSWMCGKLAEVFVGPYSVALDDSRGMEDLTTKAFLRFTVLILDVLVYFPPVFMISKRIATSSKQSTISNSATRKYEVPWIDYLTIIFSLLQPSILLIDHGHFQYNTVSLGLALLSFHYMTKFSRRYDETRIEENKQFCMYCTLGSFFFCLTLNFKQMTLYYAPAVFAYLLGRCFSPRSCSSHSISWRRVTSRILMLGIVVIVVFVVLWMPFFLHPPTNDDYRIDGKGFNYIKHILHRLFPFERGLYESKVSNLWCALSVRPISIGKRIPSSYQPTVATLLTLLLILPPCVSLFHIGKKSNTISSMMNNNRTTSNNSYVTTNHAGLQSTIHLRALLWGSSCTSLAFYLASFHVHEKSILMAVAPMSLLCLDRVAFALDKDRIPTSSSASHTQAEASRDAASSPFANNNTTAKSPVSLYAPNFVFVSFFSVLASWSMWPLMQVDELEIAYWVCNGLFLLLVYMFFHLKWASVTVGHRARINDSASPTATETSSGSASSQSHLASISTATGNHYEKEKLAAKVLTCAITEWIEYITKFLMIPMASFMMIMLHVLQSLIYPIPPTHLPDLYPVLWSIVGCALFCWSWLYCVFQCDVLRYAGYSDTNTSKSKQE